MSPTPTPPDAIQASLQPPGRGLPAPELFIARILVGLQARSTSRASATQLFSAERATLNDLVRSAGPTRSATRVLIPRIRGLEDSSRYWSVYMALDHLRIVNLGTTELILQLHRNQTPARVVGTADVKPSPLADASVLAPFNASCDLFEQTIASIPDLNSPMKWPHPWFGPLSAARWHFFTAIHMRIHRRQIETILSKLPAR